MRGEREGKICSVGIADLLGGQRIKHFPRTSENSPVPSEALVGRSTLPQPYIITASMQIVNLDST